VLGESLMNQALHRLTSDIHTTQMSIAFEEEQTARSEIEPTHIYLGFHNLSINPPIAPVNQRAATGGTSVMAIGRVLWRAHPIRVPYRSAVGGPNGVCFGHVAFHPAHQSAALRRKKRDPISRCVADILEQWPSWDR
jgi:hypothetical protein